MAEAEPEIECGFCLRSNEAIEDGRVLPCTHIHCLDCLTAFYDVNHLLVCPVPTCGEVYTTAASNLPSYKHKKEEINEWCDVCTKKGGDNQPAEVYCTSCLKKCCSKHEEHHDETVQDHIKVKVEEHNLRSKQRKRRMCDEHKDELYSSGCKVCLTVFCTCCLSEQALCRGDSTHHLLPLDELTAALMDEAKKGEIVQRDKQLEKLFKDTSRFGSAYDAKTAEMVQLLHNTRDEQIRVLKERYDKLEEQLVEERQRNKVKAAKFMEETVLNKWIEIRNEWLKMESKYKHRSEVDIVKGFKDLDVLVQKIQKESLPSLELENIMTIEKLAERRDIELDVTLSSAVIGCRERATTCPSLPKSPELLRTVNLPSKPISVCLYMGCTYVGMSNGSVARIDHINQLVPSFIGFRTGRLGGVRSILLHGDEVFILYYARGIDLVCVYNLSGEQLRTWAHPSIGTDSNSLAIVAGQAVIPDLKNKRITVYSLAGEVQRHVPCSLLGSQGVVMCAVDDTSVVISDCAYSLVFRVNLTNGEVMWRHRGNAPSQDVTCYEGWYIFVANRELTVKVLHAQTGALVGELFDRCFSVGIGYSLAVDGNKLVVTNQQQKTVQYYLLRR